MSEQIATLHPSLPNNLDQVELGVWYRLASHGDEWIYRHYRLRGLLRWAEEKDWVMDVTETIPNGSGYEIVRFRDRVVDTEAVVVE